MKAKILCILYATLICQQVVTAQSVSKELATRTAIQYAKYSGCPTVPTALTSRKSDQQRDVDTTITRAISFVGKALLYLVEPEDGWVLVSSELAATPILASAPTGKFPDYEDMPEGMQWLMSYYEQSLQYARDSLSVSIIDSQWNNTYNSTRSQIVDSVIIEPMATVHWGQSYDNDVSCYNAYNKFCPNWYSPACGRTSVGCTAVAMGQVMWYWQWPYSAIIPDSVNTNGQMSSEEHLVRYDWSHMPTELHSSTSITDVNAVAGLLRDCGYASKMKYSANGSGAALSDAKNALLDRFRYKVKHWIRFWYWTGWTDKIKSEIDAGRPVIYAGYKSDDNGHTFIVYGYNTDDKFYINWGYNGTDNGSYSLDALNPATIQNGPFNLDQEAMWEIEPDYPDCDEYTILGNDISNESFEIYNGGPITAQYQTIQSHQSGVIYSGQSITILPPFTIASGANVHIAIRDMNCDMEQKKSPRNIYVPSFHDKETKEMSISMLSMGLLTISPNPVNTILYLQTAEELAQVNIYNLNGQCVLQSAQTDIDVSALPQGMYILRAETTDGNAHQTKFIKQ